MHVEMRQHILPATKTLTLICVSTKPPSPAHTQVSRSMPLHAAHALASQAVPPSSSPVNELTRITGGYHTADPTDTTQQGSSSAGVQPQEAVAGHRHAVRGVLRAALYAVVGPALRTLTSAAEPAAFSALDADDASASLSAVLALLEEPLVGEGGAEGDSDALAAAERVWVLEDAAHLRGCVWGWLSDAVESVGVASYGHPAVGALLAVHAAVASGEVCVFMVGKSSVCLCILEFFWLLGMRCSAICILLSASVVGSNTRFPSVYHVGVAGMATPSHL